MSKVGQSGNVRRESPVQAQRTESRPIPPKITADAVARSILEAAEFAEREKGAISKSDFEGMLKRAMASKPGQMNPAAAEAISLVVDRHKIAEDAKPLAEIIKDADRCRKDKGVITEKDLEGMMRRAWDRKQGGVDPAAATALRFVGWRDADIMDSGARALMTEFVSAWYHDVFESPAVKEGRRQLEEQLAQDKRDFQEFLVRDKREHKRVTVDELKEELQQKRIEASEWQTLMLWLKTGIKQKPITS